MKHEVSYVLTDDFKSVQSVVDRMSELGFDYGYRELQMADGAVHRFCVYCDKWTELPDMEAVLKWLCADIYHLKEAYDNGIVHKEVTNAE